MFTGGLTRAPGESVGTYAISQGTLSAGTNYNILFTGANFSITPGDLAVTADTNGKIYGASDPALTYTHGALFNGDTDSVFTGSLSRVSGEDVSMRLHWAASQREPTTTFCLRVRTSRSRRVI